MKELPHSSPLSHGSHKESFPQKARFVLRNGARILFVTGVLAGSAYSVGGGPENTNSPQNLENKPVVAGPGPKDPIPPVSAASTLTAFSPKPTETAKPPVEKKISISKKPEDLYHALASAPLLEKDLPSGMSVIGIPITYSQSEIHNNIAKIFGDPLQSFSGAINIRIADEFLNPIKTGFSDITLTFNVLANNQNAQAVYNKQAFYNKSTRQNGQTLPIENFPYPAVIERSTFSMYSGIVLIENVVVQFIIHGKDMKVTEQRAIDLMQTMPQLLQDAGN